MVRRGRRSGESREARRERVLREWRDMLRELIKDHRRLHPNDHRSDCEILNSLMNFYVDDGIVERDGHGGFIVPEMV
jgi:hypothetical protein